MRILLVQKDRFPRSIGGAELYEHHLALALERRGHDVRTLSTYVGPGGRPTEDDLPRNLELYEGSDRERAILDAFERLLDDVSPEIVHVQDLYGLSLEIPERARRRRVPVIATIHEFFLICPRLILRTTRGSLCAGPSAPGCFRCARDMAIDRYRGRLRPGEGGIDRLKRAAKAFGRRRASEVFFAWTRPLRIARLRAATGLFVCPSVSLRDRLAAHGFEQRKLRVLGYGLPDLGAPKAGPRAPRLRFAFIGNPDTHKGIDVLLEAARRLPEADVVVYGSPPARVADAARDIANVRLAGVLEDSGKADAYRAIDVLVVPSIWYENQPLTILEAFHFQTPVVASDLGGMRELLASGGGWLVPPGDPAALAAAMKRLQDDPSRIPATARTIPRVPPLADQVVHLEGFYRELIETRLP